MYSHILISTDGSEVAAKGLDHGLTLAKALGARVTIVTVTERFPAYVGAAAAGWFPSPEEIEGYDSRQAEIATEVLTGAQAAAAKVGVPVEVVHVANALPAEAIIDTAKSRDCALICMSSHGRRGLGRLLLGSQTAEVLAHSPVPVLVVR